jgi:PIN like domain
LSLVFFADRNLGKQFPNILIQAGLSVIRHDDLFPDTTTDEEWLREIGRQGWFAITYDQKIRYKPNEKAAVLKFDVGLFILIGKAPFTHLAYNFIETLPKICHFVEQHPRPFIAKIYRPDGKIGELSEGKPGRVEMWEPF